MSTSQFGKEPRYSLDDACLLTGVPKATLRTWFLGWPAANGRSPQPAVLRPDQEAYDPLTLSFFNIIETRFLSAYRQLGVPMQRVRLALEYVKAKMPNVPRPLLAQTFESDGRSLFVEYLDEGGDSSLLDASSAGQGVWPEVVRAYFKSIEFDDGGNPSRFWLDRDRKLIVDPRLGWGMPAIASTGLRTEIVFERFEAGEDIGVIAEDFSIDAHAVQQALRWEQQARIAA